MKRDTKPDWVLENVLRPGCILPIILLPPVVLLVLLGSGALGTNDFEQIAPYLLLIPGWWALILLALYLYTEVHSSRCPECHKWFALKPTARDTKWTGELREREVEDMDPDRRGPRYETVTERHVTITLRLKCKFCGHEKVASWDSWQQI